MSAAAGWIDAAIQREVTWERADAAGGRFRGVLDSYGASVGSVRAAVRDFLRGHDLATRDDIVALASELWARPVYERRLAAIVLLQTHVHLLDNGDLTRLEGFVRSAIVSELIEPLVREVIRPMVRSLGEPRSSRARAVLERWARDPDAALQRAAAAVELQEDG